jgi:membrane protein implicated in regulation of membrane protease activity
MRQQLATTALIAFAAPALAHTGHVEEAAGHSHWLALGAFSLAGIIAVLALARTLLRRKPENTGRTAGLK